MLKILIPEDIPSGNKGEAALYYGIVNSLNIFNEFRIAMFSMHPESDRFAYGDSVDIIDVRGMVPSHLLDGMGSFTNKIFNYFIFIIRCLSFVLLYKSLGGYSTRIMRHEVWKHFLETNLVLMCHDSFYALFYHGPLILLLKIMEKPIMLYGSTIVAPDRSNSKMPIKLRNALNGFVLKKVDRITTREERSYNYIKSLDIDTVKVYPDLAFLSDIATDDEIARIFFKEGLPKDTPLCGFAFSQKEIDFSFPELSVEERRDKALNALSAMMDHITSVHDLHAVFIPHAIGPTERLDDRIVADWIRSRCQNKEKIIIIRNDYNAFQLRGMAKKLSVTVGSRLHFTIDAACNHIPSLLITHSTEYRCHGIVGDMLKQSNYVYNIEAINAKDLIMKFDELWKNRKNVTEDLKFIIPKIVIDAKHHAIFAMDVLDN
jgi:polysaccharide pyruvyl transferase WcaK-like protein